MMEHDSFEGGEGVTTCPAVHVKCGAVMFSPFGFVCAPSVSLSVNIKP